MTGGERPSGLARLVPAIWIVVTSAWAVLIIVTDRPAWEPAIWIAATAGPLAALDRAGDR